MILAAVVLLNLPLGTVYAFSVFLRPLEAALAASRTELSVVFGLALVGFTTGMNLGPRAFRMGAPAVLLAVSGAAAAAGIALAAAAGQVWHLLVGYSLLFGIGGGVAYVVLLQGMNLALAGSRGLANGFLLSLYPAGAMLGAPLFGWSNGAFGFRATLAALAATLLATTIAATVLVAVSGMRLAAATGSGAATLPDRPGIFPRIWIVFFLAASSGLTVLGQAAVMVASYGGGAALALYGTTAITACIAAARIGGGWLADRAAVPWVLAGAHGVALLGDAVLLAASPGPLLALVGLILIGVGYGIVSGATGAAIGVYWGPTAYGKLAGRVYIAWCGAALVLPVVAGRLFDLTGGYAGAVALAGLSNLVGLGVALSLARAAPAPR